MRRTLVSSEQSLEGKIFVEFISLIFLSYIKKQMQMKDLYKSYTLQGIMDEFDVIEYVELPGKKPCFGEVIERKKKLYIDLGIDQPIPL